MKIDKSKIIKYLICFFIAFRIFSYKTYSILNSDNNIAFYKNFVVFYEYEDVFFSPLVLYDIKKAGDSKKYFYGILKLNKIENDDFYMLDDKKYLTYDDTNSSNFKFVFDGNKISYIIFNKDKKSLEVFRTYDEFVKSLNEKGISPRLLSMPLFKLFKTHRKLRTHTYIFSFDALNSPNDLNGYYGNTRYSVIYGGF